MQRSTPLLIVAGLTLLGFALRLFHINTVPLRGDEAFTLIHWVREPLADTLANIATVDPQAPLSYVLYRLWGLTVGTGEYTVRLLPALLNVIGIPALYALGKQIGGVRFGLLAALLWTIHPYQVWHAQDARNYAIWASLTPLALWLALRALRYRRRVDWALYVVAAAFAGYVYYLELFVIVVLNLYVFVTYRRDRRLLAQWIGSQVAIGLILVPWYLQERLLVGSGYTGTTGSFDPPLWFTWFLPTLTFGETLPREFVAVLWIGLLVALIVGWALLLRRPRSPALLLGLLATVPLLLLGLVSTRLGVFTPRYVLSAAPAYTLLLVSLMLGIPRLVKPALLGRALALSLFALVVGVSGFSLINHYGSHDYAKSPDWRSLASYLRDRVQPDDTVVQAAADMAFAFYFDEYRVPGEQLQLPANPQQPAEEIASILTTRSVDRHSIWYVAESPTGWANRDTARAWLADNMQTVRSTRFPRLPIDQYMRWNAADAAANGESLASFADNGGMDVAELGGAHVWREPSDELTIWLDWRPLRDTNAPLKVFVHVLGEGPQPVAQDDQFPQDGRISTAEWDVDVVFRDVYIIPIGAVAAGDYRLTIGMYDPDTGERLTADTGDSFPFATIQLP